MFWQQLILFLLADIDMYVSLAECMSLEDPTKTWEEIGRRTARNNIPENLDDIPCAIPMLGPAFSNGFITLQRLMQTLVQPIPALLKRANYLHEYSGPEAELLEYQEFIRKMLVQSWTNGIQETLKGR